MSFAMALFCKTHRYIRSASFPPGAAGGDKTRRLTCAGARWVEGCSLLHDGRRVSGGPEFEYLQLPHGGWKLSVAMIGGEEPFTRSTDGGREAGVAASPAGEFFEHRTGFVLVALEAIVQATVWKVVGII